jgi:transcriptional regulator with XRE-family HTH domain
MQPAIMISSERKRASLTQAQLAERVGISQAKISAYESGRISPSVETLERLLAAMGARLTVERGRRPVILPSRREHARTGRQLVDVMGLAAALPNEHDSELHYPRLPTPRAKR